MCVVVVTTAAAAVDDANVRLEFIHSINLLTNWNVVIKIAFLKKKGAVVNHILNLRK